MQRKLHEIFPSSVGDDTEAAASGESDAESYLNDGCLYYHSGMNTEVKNSFSCHRDTDTQPSTEAISGELHMFIWYWNKWKKYCNFLFQEIHFFFCICFIITVTFFKVLLDFPSPSLLVLQPDWKTRTCNYLITSHWGWLKEKGSVCLGQRLLQCIINCPI